MSVSLAIERPVQQNANLAEVEAPGGLSTGSGLVGLRAAAFQAGGGAVIGGGPIKTRVGRAFSPVVAASFPPGRGRRLSLCGANATYDWMEDSIYRQARERV